VASLLTRLPARLCDGRKSARAVKCPPSPALAPPAFLSNGNRATLSGDRAAGDFVDLVITLNTPSGTEDAASTRFQNPRLSRPALAGSPFGASPRFCKKASAKVSASSKSAARSVQPRLREASGNAIWVRSAVGLRRAALSNTQRRCRRRAVAHVVVHRGRRHARVLGKVQR
jgi:hypothetical protein